MTFERENIRRLKGYSYGEQPDDPRVLKLNTNENPYPPSPKVAEALRSFDADSLRRYPAATSMPFRELVAQRFSIERDQVMVTNGGDEALRLAITTFVDPGDTFGMADPSYSLYAVLAKVQDCRVVSVPLTDDFALPRDFAGQLNEAGARLTCVVNPHAPSGHLIDVDSLARLAEELHGVLLIDEAYVDFVDPALRHDSTRLVHAFDNVLLLRTLSKGYSLAGLRFGFVMGAQTLIDPMLNKTRDSYNVNAIAQALGCAAFADEEYARDTWERVRRQRRVLRDALLDLDFDVPISQSNFLLAGVPLECGRSAAEIYEALKSKGILVRYFDTPGLDDRLRITVGTDDENARLLESLEELLT